MGRYSLIYEKSPPPFVFQYESFPLAIGLTSAMHGTHPYSVQLQVILRYWDTKEIVTDPLSLEVVPLDQNELVLSREVKICQLICHLGRLPEGQSTYLEVMAHNADFESAISPPICVVKEKLVISHEPPELWFKDEGGREKCMQIKIKLQAAPGRKCENRIIPLDIQLYYESGERVSSQRILRLFPDLQPNMVSGSTVISFRIDDVSKNHQGQSFMLLIGPDVNDHPNMFRDIAPVKSTPIAIRSKRNKRRLLTQANGAVKNLSARFHPRSQKSLIMIQKSMPYNTSFPQNRPESDEHLNHRPKEAQPARLSKNAAFSSVDANPHQQNSSDSSVEWSIIGYQVYPNGNMNCERPIYRCNHCHRLIDSDRRKAQALADPAIHEKDCLLVKAAEVFPSSIDRNGNKSCEINGFRPYSDAVDSSFRIMEEREFSAQMTHSTTTVSPSNPVKRFINSVQNNSVSDAIDSTQRWYGIHEPIVHTPSKITKMETQLQWKQNSEAQESEDLVYYILAQMYCNVVQQSIGFPSFDSDQQLIGFYQETHVDCMTQVIFYPLAQVCITEEERIYLLQLFQQAYQVNAPSLHKLSNYEYNLVLLRENALMYYWSLSVSSLLVT
ncbi:unnamed protein product [Albugo candida]|uniref:Uncharacterized protein n=2 Tax=Albugo candida TaxID=65357 RepID=A0A024GP62_9STRA|nr:unnamed protein product [Albugo candida]|eukprot:CCI48321.1 unnamed protein product [Albugo candida]